MKIISCLQGVVYDVAVDLRRTSQTYLHWHAERISAEDHSALLIPEGFAHGFQTLTDDCELFYIHTKAYKSSAEGGINALDPTLAIQWPLPVTEMSERDRSHAFLPDEWPGVTL